MCKFLKFYLNNMNKPMANLVTKITKNNTIWRLHIFETVTHIQIFKKNSIFVWLIEVRSNTQNEIKYIEKMIDINRNRTVDIIWNRSIVVNQNQKDNSSTMKHLWISFEILCITESNFYVEVYIGSGKYFLSYSICFCN